MIGSYLVLKPETVIASPSLKHLVGDVAFEVVSHEARKHGRSQLTEFACKVLIAGNCTLSADQFQEFTENATMIYNDYHYINGWVDFIFTNSLKTDEKEYKRVNAKEVTAEYFYSPTHEHCVKRENAFREVFIGEFINPPLHKFMFESLKIRPVHTEDVPIHGVYGVPGSVKSGIIKQLVTKIDLMVSGKKKNCGEVGWDGTEAVNST